MSKLEYLAAIIAAGLVGWGIAMFQVHGGFTTRTYQCNFDRIQGTYTTTDAALRRYDTIIVVRGADGREHAFQKRSLRICREI